MADAGFSPGGAPTPKIAIIFQIFAKNCMKMKEFGPPGGARVPGAPPLDPPMPIYHSNKVNFSPNSCVIAMTKNRLDPNKSSKKK